MSNKKKLKKRRPTKGRVLPVPPPAGQPQVVQVGPATEGEKAK